MIKQLTLEHIGPAPKLEVEEFGSRLNVITGDNGLGKTFLLDAIWYGLTRTWADGKKFYPTIDVSKNEQPKIKYKISGQIGNETDRQAKYNFKNQTWKILQVQTPMPCLVIYARIDGGFSVWDPARNYWRDGEAAEDQRTDSYYSSSSFWVPQRPPAFQFSNKEVWDGLYDNAEGQKETICSGFLRDVVTWRLKDNGPFQLLQKVLKGISSGDEETLSIGEGVRVRIGDSQDIPTLNMPYGVVPVTHAAAGMRRVLAMAYLLVWAWDEHCRASELQKEEPAKQIVLLFDEVEAHLHPKWQRIFLPALMKAVDGLLAKEPVEMNIREPMKLLDEEARSALKKSPISVQIIATTHAPLVLASIETVWNEASDRLFDFDLDANRQVQLKEVSFAKHGSIVNWLASKSFDLTSSYSVAAEQAMESADALMQQHPDPASAPREEKDRIHAALVQSLGGDDEYWPYWLPYYEAKRSNQ